MRAFGMRTRLLSIPVLGVIFVCFVAMAFARSDVPPSQDGDLQFIRMASANCLWKVAMGNLALKQAASKNVREFGATMVADHERYYRDLSRFAGERGIVLAEDQDQGRKNTFTFFSGEYGAAFDRNYISLMMDDNRRDLQLYRQEAQKGADAEIRGFAAGIMKKLEGYILAAEKILLDLPKPVLK